MQIYAELINPKVGEDTDKIFDKISFIYRLANYKGGKTKRINMWLS